MVYNYFITMKNSREVALTYIIRKTPSPPGIVVDRKKEIIKHSPIQGNMFSHDIKKVLAIIKEITVDTDAET